MAGMKATIDLDLPIGQSNLVVGTLSCSAVGSDQVDGRAERYRHVRPDLLDRLTDHIASHGLHGLTMRNLAAGAGVSHPTLLHHFGTREALLAEVSQHVRQRLARAAEATTTPESAADLYGWWRSLSRYDRPLEFLLVIELYLDAVRNPAADPSIVKEALTDPIADFAAMCEKSGCPPDEATTVATALVAVARGLQLDLLASGDQERVDAAFVRCLHALVPGGQP